MQFELAITILFIIHVCDFGIIDTYFDSINQNESHTRNGQKPLNIFLNAVSISLSLGCRPHLWKKSNNASRDKMAPSAVLLNARSYPIEIKKYYKIPNI